MSSRNGILAAGNFIVDRVVMIDAYPPENALASIDAENKSSGGCPYTVLKDLAILGVPFPLAAIGTLGSDADGDWVRADCKSHGIDTTRLACIAGATTSYTYAMTVRTTGRRTFFHRRGANALLAPAHFDFTSSDARIFVLGYLLLLDALDAWMAPGVTGAAEVLERARVAGLETVVDLVSTSHPDYRAIVWSALPHIDHLLLNEWEATLLLGRSFARCKPADFLDGAREIAAGGVGRSVVIHCEMGVLAFDCRTRQAFAQGAVALPSDRIAGATGAGDAFTAGYLCALHAGEPFPRGLEMGVCTAAASLADASASAGMRALADCLDLGLQFGFHVFALG